MSIGYRQTYKMRKLVPNRKYISVGIPYLVIEREAATKGMSVDEFIGKFVVVAEFDNFEGVRYTFEPVKDKD